MKRMVTLTLGLATCYASAVAMAAPMTTAFTYQGQLKKDGVPITGAATIVFRLFDAEVDGTRIGPEIGYDSVDLVDGLLTVSLDFGESAFSGAARWLEVAVDYPNDGQNWATLSPRQPVTAAPYALTAKKAADLELPFAATVSTADNAVVVTQTGSGRAISLNKSAGSEAVMYAGQGGTGPCGEFFINNVGNSKAAVLASSIGTGPGVHGKGFSSGAAVQGSALGTGRAAFFTTDYATNESPTLYAEQKGTGRVGHFRITNAYNDLEAVAASTTGDGAAVSGYTVGSGPAVHAKTDGTGYAIHADSTDDVAASGGGVVMIGSETGNNVAIDGNEIMARSNGEASTLFINNDGGDVVFGGAVDIGYEVVQLNQDVEPGTGLTVHCPEGKKVLGGGCACTNEWVQYDVEASYPRSSPDGWRCACSGGVTRPMRAYAICANVK